jgi:hypothetical protein
MSDIEVFIVGDGVDDRSRAVIAELTKKDGRVRFFDFPKGERHGEASRHLALQEARGEMVAKILETDRRAELRAAFMSAALRDRAHSDVDKEAEVMGLRAINERSAAEREALAGELQGLKAERERLASQLQEAHQGLEASEAVLEKVRADLTVVLNSVTWRARERLVALPLLRQPLAWVARALAARHLRS